MINRLINARDGPFFWFQRVGDFLGFMDILNLKAIVDDSSLMSLLEVFGWGSDISIFR